MLADWVTELLLKARSTFAPQFNDFSDFNMSEGDELEWHVDIDARQVVAQGKYGDFSFMATYNGHNHTYSLIAWDLEKVSKDQVFINRGSQKVVVSDAKGKNPKIFDNYKQVDSYFCEKVNWAEMIHSQLDGEIFLILEPKKSHWDVYFTTQRNDQGYARVENLHRRNWRIHENGFKSYKVRKVEQHAFNTSAVTRDRNLFDDWKEVANFGWQNNGIPKNYILLFVEESEERLRHTLKFKRDYTIVRPRVLPARSFDDLDDKMGSYQKVYFMDVGILNGAMDLEKLGLPTRRYLGDDKTEMQTKYAPVLWAKTKDDIPLWVKEHPQVHIIEAANLRDNTDPQFYEVEEYLAELKEDVENSTLNLDWIEPERQDNGTKTDLVWDCDNRHLTLDFDLTDIKFYACYDLYDDRVEKKESYSKSLTETEFSTAQQKYSPAERREIIFQLYYWLHKGKSGRFSYHVKVGYY